MSVIQYQHVKRHYNTEIFEAVQNGIRTFEVITASPDLTLNVGDVITLQETDQNGNLTGRELSKKITYRVDVQEPNIPIFLTKEEASQYKTAVLGFAAPEYGMLRSIYNTSYTVHCAVDVEVQGTEYKVSDGPYYSPILASPDFLEENVLDGIHINKWPVGRYSVTLMIKLHTNNNKQTEINIVDGIVMTIVQGSNDTFGIKFEELNTIALLDGKTISVTNDDITPMNPKEIDDTIAFYQNQYKTKQEQEVEQGVADVLEQAT